MTAEEFIAKWRNTRFREKQASQEMFLDLCALVEHPTPGDYGDPDVFTFEKWIPGGSADAYLEGHFGWEFKSRDSQLDDGMNQLLRYQVYLKTPPLLIVSSFRTIRIRTNFPGMETVLHEIRLLELEDPENLNKLRSAFHSPSDFRPNRTRETVTKETADIFHAIVSDMEKRNADQVKLARYLNQIVFCLYAEDAGLLNDNLFVETLKRLYHRPADFDRAVSQLFSLMATGGWALYHEVEHFNGDLFRDADTVELSEKALLKLYEAKRQDWRNIEPSIFGTLFERALDASKRSQLGAHYTGADDIDLVVGPVMMQPLRREWNAAQGEANRHITDGDPAAAREKVETFRQRLASVTVLDPACGSGNFLYIALRSLLDLEKEVIDFNDAQGWPEMRHEVRPNQMLGLEINPYAAELARTALWIGYIQWHQTNGVPYRQDPILAPMNNSIRQTDAILADSNTDNPQETEWPAAEFIIGNPPFLGHFPFRRQLGDEYVNVIYRVFGDRIPNSSDYCCYWFEKARAQIEAGHTRRAGLLATQAIRFPSSRPVLSRIKETGDIFNAISDRDWMLEGANVNISIVCFDNGSETERVLNGIAVDNINPNLTSNVDVTQARRLPENANISFMGDIKVGPFELSEELAAEMLSQSNPHNKPNSDVVKRWMTGWDLNRVSRNMWIIDFGVNLPENEAALYEMPFEYVQLNVKPERANNRNARARNYWWLHGSPGIGRRQALAGLPRYIGTSMVSQHRIFTYIDGDVLPDATIIVFARDDDYILGVLQSRIHLVWAMATGTQLEDRSRYTPTTCFETFPFPEPTPEQQSEIAAAASALYELRDAWRQGDATRTLTALYNRRPVWLDNAHAALDAAVAAAYDWPPDLDDAAILERLLTLNLQQSE